jgi:cyclic pyranopterin phosphate synthase
MPELAGRPEWAVDIDRVHDWLADRADRIEHREMHDRRRYWVGPNDDNRDNGEPEDGGAMATGMVEIVDPVENPTFCANCHRVRVTHEGYLKGCLNRNDDLRSMGEMTTPEIREAFRETVDNRVPYYGEYMVRDDDGEWRFNEEYIQA